MFGWTIVRKGEWIYLERSVSRLKAHCDMQINEKKALLRENRHLKKRIRTLEAKLNDFPTRDAKGRFVSREKADA